MNEPRATIPPFLHLALFLGFLGTTVALQIENGAYRSDFGGHADEAAHVVTGLMVRDYLAGPLWRGAHPLRYAEDYYEKFPKVAIGHYPPAFYALEGLWLLPSRSKIAIVLLPAFLTSLTALAIFQMGLSLMPFSGALVASLVFCLLRLVQTYTAIVMSDMMLTLLCLLATLAFGRFLASGRARWSLLFGCLAAAAILTKASGLLLALVPPLAILLSFKFRLILNWRLWLAPLPVLLFALPWIYLTASITREGMSDIPLTDYLVKSIPYYLSRWVSVFGFVLTVLLLLGLIFSPFNHLRHKDAKPTETVLWSLIAGTLILLSLVPSGLDERYLLPAVPAVFLLAFSVIPKTLALLSPEKFSPAIVATLSILLGAAVVVGKHRTPGKQFTGASEAVTAILDSAKGSASFLVCSDAPGEGAFVASAALQGPDRLTVYRGSKLLASSDWLGRDYDLKVRSAKELESILQENRISYIVLDESVPEKRKWAHQQALERTVLQTPEFLELLPETIIARRNTAGPARLYHSN